jgi:hypothetical protein
MAAESVASGVFLDRPALIAGTRNGEPYENLWLSEAEALQGATGR